MIAVTITATPAAEGASAVPARFVMANHDEILINGTIVRVTAVTNSRTTLPGMTVIDGRDSAGRKVTALIPSGQMVELYDRDAAGSTLMSALNAITEGAA